MSDPIIHARTTVEWNLGDHGLVEEVPITVTPETTLRELVDLAGAKQSRYVSMNARPWQKLRSTDRIIVMVEADDE